VVGSGPVDGAIAPQDTAVAAELLQVEAGTEGGVGARKDEDVDVDAAVGFSDQASEGVDELDRHGVAGVGPVEGDGGHPVRHLEQDDVGHLRTRPVG
jgi:hypothetical protein